MSSRSSLTSENIDRHNAIYPHCPPSLHLHVKGDGESSSSHCTTPGISTPDSSHELDLETSDGAEHCSSPHVPTRVDNTAENDISIRRKRVHFRPRVRITSGIGRHRHQRSPRAHTPDRRDGFVTYASPSSSRSSSPSESSSISAPLRSRADDEMDKPGWGPLGRRVALLSREARWQRAAREREKRRRRRGEDLERSASPRSPPATYGYSERTPLIRPRIQSPNGLTYGARSFDVESDMSDRELEEEARIAKVMDEAFGPMPGRLLNYQWWWWQLEPIVCCRCMEDSDEE